MRKQLLYFVMMLLPILATADPVKINGIYYNLIPKANQAEVTANPNYYNGEIEIPEVIEYDGVVYNVTSIGDQAFARCFSLTSVTIPNGIVTIYDNAFLNCEKLTSLVIPNSVTTLGDWVFMGCNGLTSVKISNNLKDVGVSTFARCKNLAVVEIPNSLTKLSGSMFYDCSSLTSVTIPNSVERIEGTVFYGCSSLSSVTIPNTVTSIGGRAFYGCNNLTIIKIGNGIKIIDSEAFANCSNLADVYCFSEDVPYTGDGIFQGSYIEYATLHVVEKSIGLYNASDLWKNFKEIVKIMPEHNLTYVVDDIVYKTYRIEEGANIIAESSPTKEGYTFSGWSDIPRTMPDHDVTVTGTFTVNKYKLTYIVDGDEYKSYEIEYNSSIDAEEAPTMEGYTFSGWSEIPETMPAKDVTITGTFTINKYKLIYKVDNEEYKSYDVEYNSNITAESATTKEGYTFSGWSEIPQTMPAHDVTVTGTFTINKYKLTYIVDGEEYKSYEIEYNSGIDSEEAPTKEGYTFSGWSEIPETMPAKDVTITGTFIINKYKLIYKVDDEEYKSYDVEYNSPITAETAPTKEGYTFSGWSEIPETMPTHDVTVTGTFTINKYKLIYIVDGEEYKSIEVEYNSPITPEADPTKDGYDFFGWTEIPETMPAHDITITGSFERRYDVGNVTSLISFILRGNGGSDDLAIYDMNGNGVLDIGDLILIVRKVLNSTKRSAITRADMNYLAPNLTQYSAAQFVLNVPENIREKDICLVEGIKQTHQMMCKQIEPGAYAVVVYSLTNSLFMPENGSIIEVNDGKVHSDDLSIQDVILAKPTGETKLYGYMPVSTSIFGMEIENNHRHVYDLKGQKQNRVNGMQKGVYIENGKKIVVR